MFLQRQIWEVEDVDAISSTRKDAFVATYTRRSIASVENPTLHGKEGKPATKRGRLPCHFGNLNFTEDETLEYIEDRRSINDEKSAPSGRRLLRCARIISTLHALRRRHRRRIQGQGELLKLHSQYHGCVLDLSQRYSSAVRPTYQYETRAREKPLTPRGADKKPPNSPVL
ncbi:hypothetical protein HPB51_014978 [Rhipicephalus microplus]|uniref:Uncharacterized protein n=1 Tax=Rhipicephalus microplus TaxID=6941 RepID=A0A9J6E235_RHIMP|nr:hypothetical protein HPB51_014978 [Rhipicephalus microplus]